MYRSFGVYLDIMGHFFALSLSKIGKLNSMVRLS